MAKKRVRAGGMTKREAVRLALTDLGRDAMPLQLLGHIRTKYGIEMSADHVSVEKRKALLMGADKPKPAPAKSQPKVSAARQAEPKEPAPRPSARPPAPQGSGAAIGMQDLEAVKGLVERVGADSLKKLIGVLAR